MKKWKWLYHLCFHKSVFSELTEFLHYLLMLWKRRSFEEIGFFRFFWPGIHITQFIAEKEIFATVLLICQLGRFFQIFRVFHPPFFVKQVIPKLYTSAHFLWTKRIFQWVQSLNMHGSFLKFSKMLKLRRNWGHEIRIWLAGKCKFTVYCKSEMFEFIGNE